MTAVRILVTSSVALMAAAPGAAADTPAGVRARLAHVALRPAPLYPTRLPLRIQDSNAALSFSDGGFDVTWTRRGVESGQLLGYLTLGRGSRRELSEDLRIARSRGFQPRRTRVGRFATWYLCGHICGYAWRAQSYTYSAFGIYYLQPGSERADLRALIKRLAPLQPSA